MNKKQYKIYQTLRSVDRKQKKNKKIVHFVALFSLMCVSFPANILNTIF